MTDPVAIDARAATALVAAAATATPPTDDLAAWAEAVGDRAEAMLRLVPAVVDRSAVLAECRPVTGVIVKVEEVKGRGVVTFAATMGKPSTKRKVEFDAHGRPLEWVRTAWLSDRAGRVMYATASALIGRHCRFGKRMEGATDADGEAMEVRMVEWIEDLGPDPLTLNHTSTPTNQPTNGQRRPVANEPSSSAPSQPERPARSPGSVTRPSREDVARAGRAAVVAESARAAGEPWTDQTFIDVGWRDRKEHDDTRRVIRDTLAGASPDVKDRIAAYCSEKGYVWREPWVAERAALLLARLDEMIRNEEAALVSVGGGEPDYGFGEEPF